MEKVVIIGAGGHAKVIADIILQNKAFEIAGLVDHKGAMGFWGIPVIGSDKDLSQIYNNGIRHAFVAIGSNHLRKKLANEVRGIGFCLVNAISMDAIISKHCTMGGGIAIMPGAVVNADVVIGDGCIINTNASVDHEGILGEYVHIAPGSSISGKVRIGNNSFIGTGCRIIDNISIGEDVIAGAGTVIVNHIESNCTVVGVPARKIK